MMRILLMTLMAFLRGLPRMRELQCGVSLEGVPEELRAVKKHITVHPFLLCIRLWRAWLLHALHPAQITSQDHQTVRE